eukprot:TRINITY_DN7023_c0_g1_i1.p2 TRINITY_DN7023_c0_g1~~TRINITY_DN7023_c0_g1_i1.p2  ORF type:complete len:189 (-),score=-16.96 TRINITY_DN7023_c0_g1_i1:827-1393(-)
MHQKSLLKFIQSSPVPVSLFFFNQQQKKPYKIIEVKYNILKQISTKGYVYIKLSCFTPTLNKNFPNLNKSNHSSINYYSSCNNQIQILDIKKYTVESAITDKLIINICLKHELKIYYCYVKISNTKILLYKNIQTNSLSIIPIKNTVYKTQGMGFKQYVQNIRKSIVGYLPTEQYHTQAFKWINIHVF